MSIIRVAIVEDSEVTREALREMLELDGDIAVVGHAASGDAARACITSCRPNVVTMDIMLPGESGLSVIEWIMAQHPLPVLVITSTPTGEGATIVFDAVRRGALEVIAKPSVNDVTAGAMLRATVRELSRVPVIRHLAPTARRFGDSVRSVVSAPTKQAPIRRDGPRIVALGASAGGPSALSLVLRDLPASFPAAIVAVQHLPYGFAESFSRFLRDATHRDVVLVKERIMPMSGTIYLPSGEHHIVVDKTGALVPLPGDLVDGHRPSVTVLFRAVAEVYQSRAVGVVLTGIGADGADGLVAMHQAGAMTLTQDAESSAVFGMPRAAAERGGARRVLPLSSIAAAICEAVES